MDAPSRRVFLSLAMNAIAAAAIGASGAHLIGVADAMPVDPDLSRARPGTGGSRHPGAMGTSAATRLGPVSSWLGPATAPTPPLGLLVASWAPSLRMALVVRRG
ncbi:hypothetical protein ABH984_002840 [Bradyrhizobium ottawaense]|uniref:hypothetical protein n=1 Tax=Bradyrhizobium ottawaense TaxID=931866 RepID=UPI00351840D8